MNNISNRDRKWEAGGIQGNLTSRSAPEGFEMGLQMGEDLFFCLASCWLGHSTVGLVAMQHQQLFYDVIFREGNYLYPYVFAQR